MSASRTGSPVVDRIMGAVLAILTVAVVSGVYLGYQGTFASEVQVLLRTPRAGLLLDKGAAVRVLGVRVGTVRSISAQGETALVTIGIESDRARDVPSNSTVELKPTTIFGAKYVELEIPAKPSGTPVAEGAVLKQTGTTVETNEVFENVVDLLTAVQPQKVNAALSAVAGGLSGRGKTLGVTISQANDYLGGIEPLLPDAERDLKLAAQVLPVYQQAYPSLVSTLDDFRTTSATLVTQRAAIGTFLVDLRTATGDTTALAVDAAGPLNEATTGLRAPVATLNRYSSTFSCLIKGVAKMQQLALPAFLTYPGVISQASVMSRAEPYKFPQDLPKVGVDNAPSCYGLPFRSSSNPIGELRFDDGRAR